MWPLPSPTSCVIRWSAGSLQPMIESRRRRVAPGRDMSVLVDIDDDGWRRVQDLGALAERAVATALAHGHHSPDKFEVSLLFTGDTEAARVNREWRNETYVPNVLSFPAAEAAIPAGEIKPLGDIVLAAGRVAAEAAEQEKSLDAHTAHLIV